jgi:hypothetical protein
MHGAGCAGGCGSPVDAASRHPLSQSVTVKVEIRPLVLVDGVLTTRLLAGNTAVLLMGGVEKVMGVELPGALDGYKLKHSTVFSELQRLSCEEHLVLNTPHVGVLLAALARQVSAATVAAIPPPAVDEPWRVGAPPACVLRCPTIGRGRRRALRRRS